jgi:hypothetical protein
MHHSPPRPVSTNFHGSTRLQVKRFAAISMPIRCDGSSKWATALGQGVF